MKQVYYSDVSATPPSLPATAQEGYPQDGTVSGNAQATVPGAYWFHMVSSEIENAIRAGGKTPDAAKLNQLAEVIGEMHAATYAVSYEPQTLTNAQKTQARTNIHAMSEDATVVRYETQNLTAAQQTVARNNIGARAADAIEPRDFLPRLSAPAALYGAIWRSANEQNWGMTDGIDDAMLDPQDPDVLYVATSGTGRQGTMWKCTWDGSKFVAQTQSAAETFSHQGNAIYHPEGAEKVYFFGGRSEDRQLVLRSWSGVDGAAPVVERVWTVLTSDMATSNSVTRAGLSEVVYTGLSPAVSPDQKKLLVRMVRQADAVVVFRVFDIETLLESGGDVSRAYEATVDEPNFDNWGMNKNYDISRQSVAFDGQIIYCLDSHTGNSGHYVKAFDLLGHVACERPATWEGKEQADLGNCEGESLRFCRDRLGRLTLMMAVNEFGNDVRYSYLYDITGNGIGYKVPWAQQWSSRLHIAEDGTVTIRRAYSDLPTQGLKFSGWGLNYGGIGIYGGYLSYESTKDFRISAGVGENYQTAVRLLANSAYKAFACDGTGESGAISLGRADRLWSQVYAAAGSINTSDERLKANIRDPEEALMRAWGKVNFRVFQFKDAVEHKGAGARLHVGVIAQQVRDAFASEGLDADRYGLFCHDSWEAVPEHLDPVSKEIVPATEGGDRYGIRYEEALALECAYQRWRLEKLEAKING